MSADATLAASFALSISSAEAKMAASSKVVFNVRPYRYLSTPLFLSMMTLVDVVVKVLNGLVVSSSFATMASPPSTTATTLRFPDSTAAPASTTAFAGAVTSR